MSTNRLQKALSALEKFPKFMHPWLRDLAIGRTIPFVKTARLSITQLDQDGCRINLHNRKRVQNHIGGVHAAATALLAETATGLALGWYLADDKLPLLKQMKIDYVKRAEGNLRAHAALTPDMIGCLQNDERGSVVVPVMVTDSVGNAPVICTMEWAFIPRQRAVKVSS